MPFDVYSMRQAIEEGFILDVLQNYTPYKVAFRLAHEGAEFDDREVERSAALKRLTNTKEQFANSPDLNAELLNAIMSALDAHTTENIRPCLAEEQRRQTGCPARKTVLLQRRQATRSGPSDVVHPDISGRSRAVGGAPKNMFASCWLCARHRTSILATVASPSAANGCT